MKVLIVDDEKNLLEMVQSTIAWNSLGITEILTAYEGISALEVIRTHRPDIVITDIEMPVMDGLQLSRRIREDIPDPPEIIFLTCHAEFGYAQQALQLGATNYLLKPFLPEELTAVLSKSIVARTEKQRNRQLHEQAAAYENSRDYMVRGLLRDILDHAFDSSPEALAKEAARRNIPLDSLSKSYMVAVGANVEESLKSYSKSELMFIFRNIIGEVMFGLNQTRGSHIVEYPGQTHYTACLFLQEDSFTRQAVDNKCTRLAGVLKHYFDLHVLCVVSKPIVPADYARIRDEMSRILFYSLSSDSGVIHLEDTVNKQNHPENQINQKQIAKYLQERKKNELLLYMRHFLEQQEKQLNNQEMKVIHHDLMQVFYGYLYENDLSTHDFARDAVSQTIQANAQFSSVNMMKYVSYMYDCATRAIDQSRKSDTVIERAKRYIREHYTENIGRTEIAEAVSLAPSYLSKLFHRETGQTIREYINQCRIEAAKRIMDTTQDSITEIALQVGFDNISYFSTIFKKYTNLSPGEYRHNLETHQEE